MRFHPFRIRPVSGGWTRQLIAALLLSGAVIFLQTGFAQMKNQAFATQAAKNHPYVGMWMTADGNIRHNLLENGRYDEAPGNRESAFQGRYGIQGNRIEYLDDTGFTADGEFINGVLHHAGMIFYRDGNVPGGS